jgi:hypothetical protein
MKESWERSWPKDFNRLTFDRATNGFRVLSKSPEHALSAKGAPSGEC